MIEPNFLNTFSKEFPKEINELKLLIAVHNDIKNHFNIMKNSVEIETKHLELLYKNIIQTSKSFMSEISSSENENVGGLPTGQPNVDYSNLVNISMSFGNLFDLIGKIFFDELVILRTKTNESFSAFNEAMTSFSNYFVENVTLCFKDFSQVKSRHKTASVRLEKLYKELENTVVSFINKRKNEEDKFGQSEKNILLYSDFEESFNQYGLLQEEIKKTEVFTEDNLNNLFLNTIKITMDSLHFFRENFRLIADFKGQFVEKVQKALSITLEATTTVFSIDEEETSPSELFNYNFNNIDVSNLPEISENFYSYSNSISTILIFKRRLLQSINKFIIEITKQNENFLNSIQKSQKTIFNNKIDKTYSYINLTSISQLFDFLRSSFDLINRKTEDLNKLTTTNITVLLEASIRDLMNEENNNYNYFNRFNKEYQNYKLNLNKCLISKEKLINTIQNRKLSDDQKNENKFKSEENSINEQILELNNKYKNYAQEFLDNYKKNGLHGSQKQYKELFREIIVNFLTQMEKTYSQLNDYMQIKEHITYIEDASAGNSVTTTTSKEDLKVVFEVFVKEYLLPNLSEKETVDSFINLRFKQVVNLYNVNLDSKESNKDSDNDSPQMVISDEYEKIDNDFVEINLISEEKIQNPTFIYLNKCDLVFLSNSTTPQVKDLEKLLKLDELLYLQERSAGLKARTNRKSSVTAQINDQMLKAQIPLEADDSIVEKINCSLIEKNLFIQGIVFVTKKKLAFLSKFIPNKRSLVEINKEDLSSIKNNEDDFVLVKTKITDAPELKFFLQVDKFKKIVKKTFKIQNLNKINFSQEKDQIVILDHYMNGKQQLQDNNNLTTNSNNDVINELSEEFCNHLIQICQKENPSLISQEQVLKEVNLFQRLRDFNNSRLEYYNKNKLMRESFSACFVNSSPIGSCELDLPICLIYKNIYDYDTICTHKDLNYNRNFDLSLKELNNDYGIEFKYLPNPPKSNNIKSVIPQYYLEPLTYTLPLFTKLNKSELENFLENLNISFTENILQYNYKFTHPMKKKQFMGPSKLDMSDDYKVFFISPLCLIVEIKTFLSGFMLMDTFFTVAQYKYDTDLSYDNKLKRVCFNTKVTASFAIEFVKENWFKNKIESNGLVDNEEYIKNFILVNIGKVLSDNAKEYKEEEKKLLCLMEVNNKKEESESKRIEEVQVIEEVKEENVIVDEEQKKVIEEAKEEVKEEVKEISIGNNINQVKEIIDVNNPLHLNLNVLDQNFNLPIMYIIPFMMLVSLITKHILGDFFTDLVVYSLFTIIIFYLNKLTNQIKSLGYKLDKYKNHS